MAATRRAPARRRHRVAPVKRRTRLPRQRAGNRVHFQGRLPEASPVCAEESRFASRPVVAHEHLAPAGCLGRRWGRRATHRYPLRCQMAHDRASTSYVTIEVGAASGVDGVHRSRANGSVITPASTSILRWSIRSWPRGLTLLGPRHQVGRRRTLAHRPPIGLIAASSSRQSISPDPKRSRSVE